MENDILKIETVSELIDCIVSIKKLMKKLDDTF